MIKIIIIYYMQQEKKMRNINEFSTQQKAEIYFKQFLKNYDNLELPIPGILQHVHSLKQFNNFGGLIPCPYCFSCFIYPGEIIATEISKRCSLTIETNIDIFSQEWVRPGVCDHIKPHCIGGTNDIKNGIYVCSQCNKLKSSLDLEYFFREFFNFDGTKFVRKSNIPMDKIAIMNMDCFNNKCFSCNDLSKYKICYKCASKKNEIIYIA